VEQLKRVGFNERYAKLQGMFGAGVYFAENSSKSNQYVPCPDCEREACRCLVPSEKPLCLMLCRVTMGETHLVHSKYSAREFEVAFSLSCSRSQPSELTLGAGCADGTMQPRLGPRATNASSFAVPRVRHLRR
jgi:hypothetical protein